MRLYFTTNMAVLTIEGNCDSNDIMRSMKQMNNNELFLITSVTIAWMEANSTKVNVTKKSRRGIRTAVSPDTAFWPQISLKMLN